MPFAHQNRTHWFHLDLHPSLVCLLHSRILTPSLSLIDLTFMRPLLRSQRYSVQRRLWSSPAHLLFILCSPPPRVPFTYPVFLVRPVCSYVYIFVSIILGSPFFILYRCLVCINILARSLSALRTIKNFPLLPLDRYKL